ncbi:uncharacterized protein LOC128093585 isoform X1 [Culex pipiens pallens]|uniref:uncharacterized protein LOC128093585 isoform X1 n=1 Tax=Culex pipiens pallens TaxID=42434 RepID=UPI0022AABEF4|nr:uncharacterized protein LOC128093585 isoform X1 [Culex pipiens pallens]
MLHQYTTRRKHQPKTSRRTWTSPAQLILPQVSCRSRCICLALAQLDTAATLKKSFLLHTDRNPLTPTLLLRRTATYSSTTSTARKRNTSPQQQGTSLRICTAPAQLILPQVSCRSRCICLALAHLDTAATLKKSFLLHTDCNPLTPTLLLCRPATYSSTTSTARRRNTSPQQQDRNPLTPMLLLRRPATYSSTTSTARRRNTSPQQQDTSLRTCTSQAQLILSQVSCRCIIIHCICPAEVLRFTALNNKLSLPPPDDPVIPTTLKLTSSLELMAHRSISRQHLGSHRTPNVKYNTSNQVSDKQYQLTHKSTRRAKPREEYGDCDRHSVQLNFDSLLLNKRFSERVIHPNLQWIF